MTDNSLGQARSLGVLGTKTETRQDFVGKRDRVDFYKFSLKRSRNVDFQLSGLQGNADLNLLNGSGKVIARSRKGGSQPEQVTRQLTAGTYYVQVVGRSKKGTQYQLVGSATVGGGNNPGAGTAGNPIDLGTLTGGPVVRSRETGGEFTSPRVYKFNLAQITDVSIALSQVTGKGELNLYFDSNRNGKYDNNDQSVAFGEASESFNDPISSKVLPAIGTYFVTVYKDVFTSSKVVYDLTATATPVFPSNLPTDPGSEPTTAYNLGTLNRGGQFEAKDYVGRLDETDIFRFTLGEASRVTFGKVEIGDINITTTLYQDKNNNNILDSGDAIGQYFAGQTSQNLAAGTYFVSTTQSNLYNSAYTLTFSAS